MPGSPQTNMYFTLYGYNTLEQARRLVRDLKMVCRQQNCMQLDIDIAFLGTIHKSSASSYLCCPIDGRNCCM